MNNHLCYQKQFVEIIEASLPQLENLRIEDRKFSILEKYRRLLQLYYQKDVVEMENLIASYNIHDLHDFPDFEILNRVSLLRLAIRKNKIRISGIVTLLSCEEIVNPDIWRTWSSEVYGIIAFAYGELEEFEASKDFYLKAIDAFAAIGAYGKQSRALHNYIATLASIDTNKCLTKEYFSIYKAAFKLKTYDIAGLALANIAREYQVLGILKYADMFSKKAIKLVNSNPNTVQYYLVLLYRAHILIDLKFQFEAREILNQCRSSLYSEIQGGLLILDGILENKKPSEISLIRGMRLLDGWMDRLRQSQKPHKKLTALEAKFIYYISTKERSLEEILKYLYGDRINRESLKNRFNILVNRISKKWPYLVEKKSQFYSLT
ncbi:MAG: hypothetical protein ACXVCY_09635 [Pseudobdellovibrionaceae bacterium]